MSDNPFSKRLAALNKDVENKIDTENSTTNETDRANLKVARKETSDKAKTTTKQKSQRKTIDKNEKQAASILEKDSIEKNRPGRPKTNDEPMTTLTLQIPVSLMADINDYQTKKLRENGKKPTYRDIVEQGFSLLNN